MREGVWCCISGGETCFGPEVSAQDDREMLLFAEDFTSLVTDTGERKPNPAVVSSEHGGGLFILRSNGMIIY